MSGYDDRVRYGSDLMADVLRSLDIKYAALNPGSTFRGLHDSIVNFLGNSKPEIILCCHEEIAVSMAQGYGKAAGKPMAAIVHNVVGLLHATMAIYNAWLDEAPLLVLGGTGPMAIEKRKPWIDWIHTALVQGNAVRDFVKWDDQPFSLASVPDSLLRAHQIATTDPQGPVYICLDMGLQEEPVSDEIRLPHLKRYPNPSPPQADTATIERVAELLVGAKNPVVIADYMGRNPGAVASLVELAELLALPVIDAAGRFNFPNTHPLDLTWAQGELLKDADVVLALDVYDLSQYLTDVKRGTRQIGQQIPENCQVVHITLQHLAVKSWAQSFGKLVPVDMPITADTALALPALTAACRKLLAGKEPAEITRRFERLRARHEALRQQWQGVAESDRDKSPLSVPWLLTQVWDVIKNEDWALVNDDVNAWARRLWDWERPYQYAGSNAGSTSLGTGLGHALGVALAHQPEGRLCIDLQKDGDLLYTPSALWTAAHHHIPLLVIMDNNRRYHNSEQMVEQIARARGRPVENSHIGTFLDKPPVDYAGLARSFGLYGEGPIENTEELRPALERAVRVVKDKHQLALVDVVTRPSR